MRRHEQTFFQRRHTYGWTDTGKDAQHHSSSRKHKSKLQCDTTSHLSKWLKLITQKTTDICKDVEKREPSYTLDGAATLENSMEVPQKVKNRSILWSSNCTTGYLPKEYKDTNWNRYMHSYVYRSIIYNSQDMETDQVSVNWWMDIKKMSEIHMEYYPATIKNEILPFSMTWMELESIILSKMCQ